MDSNIAYTLIIFQHMWNSLCTDRLLPPVFGNNAKQLFARFPLLLQLLHTKRCVCVLTLHTYDSHMPFQWHIGALVRLPVLR
jgi:hypothetical protein